MKAMKEAGRDEVAALRRRTIRALAMGRIGSEDSQFINERLDEIDARIVSMEERPNKQREF